MDKYNLSREQVLHSANQNLITNIYNSARLEGVNVTSAQIKSIINDKIVSGINEEDLQIILNLYNAWKFVLSNLDVKMNLEYACKVNSFVSYNESLDWGVLRYGEVGINGVSYKPLVPVEETVRHEISQILTSGESITYKAITYMLYGMRSQLFWDGNKRTSILCANKLLIQHGKGLITVPEKELPEFHKLLSNFYETNECKGIYSFIYNKCLYR